MFWTPNLCRFCGQIASICYKLFDPRLGLKEKVYKCLNLQISEDDFKPKEICEQCCKNLSDFANFLDLCLDTNIKFESVYYTGHYAVSVNDKSFYEMQMGEDLSSQKHSVIVANKSPTVSEKNTHTYTQEDLIAFNVSYNTLDADVYACNKCEKSKTNEEGLILNDSNLLDEFAADVSYNLEESGKNVANNEKIKPMISVDAVKASLEQSSQTSPLQWKQEKLYACTQCDKQFKRKLNLSAHMAHHTNIKQFECVQCHKAFAVKCQLTQHQKSHSELFKCQICEKKFEVPSKLARHMRIHNASRPFFCDFKGCEKAFSDKNNLKQHMFCHTNIKSLNCDICNKPFKAKKYLQAHMKVHRSEAVYQCSFCDKKFRHKHNLKAHLVKHNNTC